MLSGPPLSDHPPATRGQVLAAALARLVEVCEEHPSCLVCHCYRDTVAECLRLAAAVLDEAGGVPALELHDRLAAAEAEHG
jgi:hypothetical protein